MFVGKRLGEGSGNGVLFSFSTRAIEPGDFLANGRSLLQRKKLAKKKCLLSREVR